MFASTAESVMCPEKEPVAVNVFTSLTAHKQTNLKNFKVGGLEHSCPGRHSVYLFSVCVSRDLSIRDILKCF